MYVPIVDNSSASSGDGLCWAASVASIVAYYNQTSALTSLGMYNVARSQLGLTTPDSNCTVSLLRYFGINCTETNSNASYSTVTSKISQGKPIYAAIRSGNDTSSDHAVVICGYYSVSGGYKYYSIMDPNSSSYVNATVNSNNFTYTNNGTTYSTWYKKVVLS